MVLLYLLLLLLLLLLVHIYIIYHLLYLILLLKINHLNFGEILENVGIDFIVTPHVIASNHILRYIRAKENSKGGSMESLIRLLDDNIEIMEFKINDDFKKINKELKNIKHQV